MKNGLRVAGAILEIIAGALWLLVSLVTGKIASYWGLKLDILQIIMPICFIMFGVLSFSDKRKKADFIVYGILNLVFIALQFYYASYVGLGILQMILLLIAAICFFVSAQNC